MEEEILGFILGGIAIVSLFVVLPWMIFHYMTRWKQSASLTQSDEKLLDDLHEMARRLDDRLCTIERIMTAENPNWRQQCLPESASRIADELEQARSAGRARSRITTGE